MPISKSFQQLVLRFIDPVQHAYEVIRVGFWEPGAAGQVGHRARGHLLGAHANVDQLAV